jgi:hypothetical protein
MRTTTLLVACLCIVMAVAVVAIQPSNDEQSLLEAQGKPHNIKAPKHRGKPYACEISELIPGQGGVGMQQVADGVKRAKNEPVKSRVKDAQGKAIMLPAGYTTPAGEKVHVGWKDGVDLLRPVAVVIGPTGGKYVVDAHHHLSTLRAIGETRAMCETWDSKPNMNMAQFDDYMRAKGWRDLRGASGGMASVDSVQLPKNVDTLRFSDNPWRTVAGGINFYVKKKSTNGKGCWEEKGVIYKEFDWAKFFSGRVRGRLLMQLDAEEKAYKARNGGAPLPKSRDQREAEFINNNLTTIYDWCVKFCPLQGGSEPRRTKQERNAQKAAKKAAKKKF